jgi:Protein of unknown function (DUF2723)
MVSVERLQRVLPPLAVGGLAIALGLWRLMPGVGYWDTAEFQTVPPILGTAHPTGYPTYVIFGWLASVLLTPLGEPAFRMNLLSAIFVGVAVAITVDLVRVLTRSSVVGIVAGVGLALTPITWAIGTHADPHALHLTFVAAILWLLVRWATARREDPDRADRWLVIAAAVTGLSIGNHSLTLLLGPPIVLFVLAVEPRILLRWRLIVACLAAVVLPTVLVYLELPLRSGWLRAPLVYAAPSTWDGFWYVALGEQFRGGISDPFGELPRKATDLAMLAGRELGALAPVVVAGFLATVVRFPAYAVLTGSALAITCFFNAAYINADIERYYLGPALIAWTWLAILAATVVDGIAGAAATRTEPASDVDDTAPGADDGPAIEPGEPAPVDGPRRLRRIDPFRLVAVGLAAILLLLPSIATFSERATKADRTADRSAVEWLDAALAEIEPNAIVVSWWSYSTSLWYAQLIEGRRTDIFVADDRTRLDLNMGELTDVIDRNLATRPVYVIRIDTRELAHLLERYTLTPLSAPIAQNVFRVPPRAAADGRP